MNGQLLVQYLLVEGHAETVVNKLPMKESLTAEWEREREKVYQALHNFIVMFLQAYAEELEDNGNGRGPDT